MWQPCKHWGNWLRLIHTEHALHLSSAIGLLSVAQASLRLHAHRLSFFIFLTSTCTSLGLRKHSTHTSNGSTLTESTVLLLHTCKTNANTHTHAPKSRTPNAVRSDDGKQYVNCSQRSLERGFIVCNAADEQRLNDACDRDGQRPNERFCYFSGT